MKIVILSCLLQFILYSQAATIRTSHDIREYEKFLRDSVNGKQKISISSNMKHDPEMNGNYEGDIILSESQIKQFVKAFSGNKNAVTDETEHWPNKTVVFDIYLDDFAPPHVADILIAISNITENSCLTFREKKPEDNNYIDIRGTIGKGCSSMVGYQGNGPQLLNLEPGSDCFRHGTIIHEILHTLGFHHMQSTHNRDEYVEILWDNIDPDSKHYFQIYSESEVSNLGTEYDYGSILHNALNAFTIESGLNSMRPLKETTEEIGQRNKMSESDIIKLNRLYDCPEK